MEFSDILICHFVFGLTKISVVLFYKRIFTTRRFVLAANIVLVTITLFILISFFVSFAYKWFIASDLEQRD